MRPASVYLSDAWGQDLIARLAGGAIPRAVVSLPAPLGAALAAQGAAGVSRPPLRRDALRSRAREPRRRRWRRSSPRCPPDTIVVLHGDHGERLMASTLAYRWYRLRRDLLGASRTQKLEGHETDVYEDLVRVPLARRRARTRAGRRARRSAGPPGRPDADDPRSARAADAAGARRREPAARRSASNARSASRPSSRRSGACAARARDRRRGWRTERWKYVEAPNAPDVADELFDLVADPRERRNLAAERARRSRASCGPASPPSRRRRSGKGAALSADEEAAVEARLRDLGYIE